MDVTTNYFLGTTLLFVSEGLAALSISDVRGCCRLHRRYESSAMDLNANQQNGYIPYVYDSASKLLEYCRVIASDPDMILSLSAKCDLDSLSRDISSIYSLMGSDSPDSQRNQATIRKLKELKDFVGHLIALQSESMEPQDYNDGSLGYAYFLMFSNLHSFLRSSAKMAECRSFRRA